MVISRRQTAKAIGICLATKEAYTPSMPTAYLYQDEQEAVKARAPDLAVETETRDAFETLRQIKMRASMVDFSTYPAIKDVAQKLSEGQNPDMLTFEDVPPDAQKELFFVIGARGVHALMRTLIDELNDADDIETLASLSAIRHKLLEINASTTHR